MAMFFALVVAMFVRYESVGSPGLDDIKTPGTGTDIPFAHVA
jgi:hypothetical protein